MISTIYNVSSKLCASSSSVLRSVMRGSRGFDENALKNMKNMKKMKSILGDLYFAFFRKTVALLPEQDEEQVGG